MQNSLKKQCIIFGGTGYVGKNFAKFLINKNEFSKVILADIRPLKDDCKILPKEYLQSEKIIYKYIDVREKISLSLDEDISLICNFAAIHREPGHEDEEYFETNIKGAKNVCDWAETISCNNILFTSSISPYGEIDRIKNETTTPYPSTPYGISKLIAEKIHEIWASKESRKLTIIRPGVIFGPYEGGNLTRMIKALKSNYFFYVDNKELPKAAIYIEELCEFMFWVMQNNETGKAIANATINPPPTISDFVKSISSVLKKKAFVINVPYLFLLYAAKALHVLLNLLKIKNPFSPARIKKLKISNNVFSNYAKENNYSYKYDLNSSLEDWYKKNPTEW